MTFSRMSQRSSRLMPRAPKENNTMEYEVIPSYNGLGILYRAKDPSLFEFSYSSPKHDLQRKHDNHDDVALSELSLKTKSFTERIVENMSKDYMTIQSSLKEIQKDIYYVSETCNSLKCEFNSASLILALEKTSNKTMREIFKNLLEAALSVEEMRKRLQKLNS